MLELTNVALIDSQYYSPLGAPINPTGETIELKGWPDQMAKEYATDLGAKFYIPVKK